MTRTFSRQWLAAMPKDKEDKRLQLVPWASGSNRSNEVGRPCILFSVEAMRARKMTTGAPVVLALSTSTGDEKTAGAAKLIDTAREWCIGAAWPSFSLAVDGGCYSLFFSVLC